MPQSEMRELLDFAVEVASRAGRVALSHYQTSMAADIKPDATPVTEADRQSETIARTLIRGRFPDDGILGEEFGAEREGARRRWILDPIDGTRSFIRGVPLWGVLIALEEDGESRLGVLHFPALGETVYAAQGEGCWWDGRRARVSNTRQLEDALVLTTDERALEKSPLGKRWNDLRDRVGFARSWGDCYGYALVATGRAEAMIDPVLSPWDIAALGPIIRESGGVFTSARGDDQHPTDSALATNAALATEIRKILRGKT